MSAEVQRKQATAGPAAARAEAPPGPAPASALASEADGRITADGIAGPCPPSAAGGAEGEAHLDRVALAEAPQQAELPSPVPQALPTFLSEDQGGSRDQRGGLPTASAAPESALVPGMSNRWEEDVWEEEVWDEKVWERKCGRGLIYQPKATFSKRKLLKFSPLGSDTPSSS